MSNATVFLGFVKNLLPACLPCCCSLLTPGCKKVINTVGGGIGDIGKVTGAIDRVCDETGAGSSACKSTTVTPCTP